MKTLALLAALAIGAYSQSHYEVTSLLGRKLESAPDTQGAVEKARKALAADPDNIALVLKLSQAQASVWENKEAEATCTAALAKHPDNADLLTERGHRRVALRDFAGAKADLEKSAKLKSDSSDTYYHLGLAHFFLGEFAPAAAAFCERGLPLAKGDDAKVNFTNWCYATSRRAGKNDQAAKAIAWVGATAPAGHSEFYYNLVRFFQKAKTEAEIVPADAGIGDMETELRFTTIAYGVANFHMANGETAKARAYYERIVKGKVWGTWGFVGSEVELARLNAKSRTK